MSQRESLNHHDERKSPLPLVLQFFDNSKVISVQPSTRCTTILLLLCMTATSVTHSQHGPRSSYPLRAFSERSVVHEPRLIRAFPETLRILAAMVAFQPDSDLRTTGKGQFDLSVPATPMIDPPPHNKTYFQNHLTFANNYFRSVSNGKVLVEGTVLDSVFRLPNQMSHYSPPRTSSNNIELGNLMNDTWKLVDSMNGIWHAADPAIPRISFRAYEVFVVFHAGIGKDIDLASCAGYDPTPFDVPSIYLNPVSLKKMPGSFNLGVVVNGGQDTITNSIIMPETETRENPCTFPVSTLQLGINGLLVANIGSHLGLPDLFDTQTGGSGIGRFGLMDGQSIFSWGGVFPPEPSAWEKCFLGWVNPITIAGGDTVYDLPAVSLTATSDTIYRVLISEREYFLVENRNRDSHRDSLGRRHGVTITQDVNGSTIMKSWLRDTVGFNAYDQDSLYGVVTNVDDFDWSLPGYVSSSSGEWYDGGILIWHVDENVIEANLASNTVNADSNHRGVNLMEADGSQDIGQSYGLLEPGYGSESGTPLDFWYAGNPAPLRIASNAFTPTSYPSSMSNKGANSHVYISGFSVRGPRMTMRVKIGDEQIKVLAGFPKHTGAGFGAHSITVANLDTSGVPDLLIASDSKIYGWKVNGQLLLPSGDTSGVIANSDAFCTGAFFGKVGVGSLNGKSDFLIGENNCGILKAWSVRDSNMDKLADSLFVTISYPLNIVTSPVISDSFIAVAGPWVVFATQDGQETWLGHPHVNSDAANLSLWKQPDVFLEAANNGWVVALSARGSNFSVQLPSNLSSSGATAVLSSKIGRRTAVSSIDGYVYLLDDGLRTVSGFPVATGSDIHNSPAIADIDGDGIRDIVVFSGNRIWAINAAGSVLDNFPITVLTSRAILTSPIVADLDGNGTPDIVAVTQEGLVVAYDKTGKIVPGFPLQAGPNGGSTPAAFTIPTPVCSDCPLAVGLAVASDDGHVYAWKTALVSGFGPASSLWGGLPWPQHMHDAQNTGLDESVPGGSPATSEFFPGSRAYNWPNPVNAAHGYKTHIRYFVRENAHVHIKIFDLAGDAVTEFEGPGQGGLDNEIEWDVHGIQSGVYFAHIEAQGASEHGVAVIKIAVIK